MVDCKSNVKITGLGREHSVFLLTPDDVRLTAGVRGEIQAASRANLALTVPKIYL